MAPFGKELLIRLTVCSLCIMSICYFVFPILVSSGTVVLVVPVPDHCLSFTYWKLYFQRILLSDNLDITISVGVPCGGLKKYPRIMI